MVNPPAYASSTPSLFASVPLGAMYPAVVCASTLSGIPSLSESKSSESIIPSPSVSLVRFPSSSIASRIPSLSSSRSVLSKIPSPSVSKRTFTTAVSSVTRVSVEGK